MPYELDDEAIVRSRLANAGLPASDAEVAVLVAAYPGIQRMRKMLYEKITDRTVAPALRYRPAE
jgi:hypothetical protein